MRANALAALEADADGIDSKTIKRAEWERFAFEIQASGLVRVRNESYLHPDEHEYVVTVENGVPVACECPADTYHAGPCKHRVAVAIRKARDRGSYE